MTSPCQDIIEYIVIAAVISVAGIASDTGYRDEDHWLLECAQRSPAVIVRLGRASLPDPLGGRHSSAAAVN